MRNFSSVRLLTPLFLIATSCSHSQEPQEARSRTAEAPRSADAASGLRPAFIAAVQAEAGPEFRFRSGPEPLAAENPAHRLSAAPSHAGLRVVPTAGSRGAGERRLELSLAGFGCVGAVSAPARVAPTTTGNRVEYARGALTEWYLNGPLGIEQGVTVAARPSCPSGDGIELRVALGDSLVPSLQGEGAGRYVELRDRAGQSWLRYSDVYAFDARSRPLPATLAVADGQIRIRVEDAGAAYPITIDPLVWSVQQQLQGSDTAASDFFGRSVAISGTTAVVGAFGATLPGKPGAGAAYVFVRSAGTWSEQQKLSAPDAAQDAAFGYSVAISGNTVVVGAPGAAQGMKAEAGAAYVFVRSGTLWSLQQRLAASDAAADDQLGGSVAIDGDSVVVGADFADPAGRSGAGAAYVFVRSGTMWSEQQKLVASDASDGAHLGLAVAISGSSVAVGSPYADLPGKPSAGAAYVFLRSGMAWSEQQKLTASDAAAGDGFGGAVALASDTLFVGAPSADVGMRSDAGAAYVFGRSGTSWSQKQRLTAGTPAPGDAFGQAVALSGSNALVGADATLGGGAAYVFSLAAMTWSQQQALSSPIVAADGSFGRGVALDTDNGLVGAPYSTVSGKADSGAVIAMALGMTKGNGQLCASAVECTSGFCVDGVCCNAACGGGSADCQACSVAAGAATDGTCAVAKAGATCRPANGVCDEAESCDGTAGTCPTDKFKAATAQCRGAAGLCDVAEFCTGTSASCPADNLKPSTAECRAAIGACDVAEKCSGTSSACPADAFKPNTVECRASAGICDVADFCTGSGPSCPSDQLKPAATPCRAAAGACDAVESCTGTSASCPADGWKPMGTECRIKAGVCDQAESCSGTSADCPADAVRPNTAECRPAAGVCDQAEFCSGTGTDCPSDGFKPNTAECRPLAGACDVAEYCSGGSPSCPTDTFKPVTTPCRAAASACDAAESCTGSDAACPQDSFRSDGTGCAGGSCQAGMCRPEADLSLALTAAPPIARQKDPQALQMIVGNLGPSPASGIKVAVEIPKGARLLEDGGGDGWSCQSTDTGASCQRQSLVSGTAPLLSVTLIPPPLEAQFLVTARVSANEGDLSTANNSVTLTIKNDAPASEGGCTMARRSGPISGGQGLAMLGICLLLGMRLRRRRALWT